MRIFSEASEQWQQVELFDFISRLIFKAGSKALMSEECASESMCQAFKDWDKRASLILGGMSEFMQKLLLPKAWKARQHIFDLVF